MEKNEEEKEVDCVQRTRMRGLSSSKKKEKEINEEREAKFMIGFKKGEKATGEGNIGEEERGRGTFFRSLTATILYVTEYNTN